MEFKCLCYPKSKSILHGKHLHLMTSTGKSFSFQFGDFIGIFLGISQGNRSGMGFEYPKLCQETRFYCVFPKAIGSGTLRVCNFYPIMGFMASFDTQHCK